MGPDRFSWVIEGKLAGMAHPGEAPEAFAGLKQLGVGAVVTLTVSPLPAHLLKEQGLGYLHLPVENFAAPLPSQVLRFVRFCDENIRAGRPVAVHCLAGQGRTGALLACYLVWQGMAAQRAIRTIRELRPGSVETDEQEQAIVEFAARLARRRSRSGSR